MKTTMRAAVLEAVNTPLVLREVPVPAAGPGQVLVHIAASGINPLDAKVAAGEAAHANTTLPAILGMDVAGTIAAVGANVENLRVGDAVYGMVGGFGGIPGSLAEFGVFDAALLARKPNNLTMREAAALPLIFITAWEGLVDHANVQPGQKVLIHGGAGGVGHVAVQLAIARGADVYATGSAEQKDMIERFGATAIDYRKETVEQYVARCTDGEGFDIVYDTVGGATLDASFIAARTYKGHVVSCLGRGMYNLTPLSFRAATYSGVFTLLPLLTGKGRAHHGAIMQEATKLAEQGKLNVNVDQQHFTLATAANAHAALANGTARGKLVVEVEE